MVLSEREQRALLETDWVFQDGNGQLQLLAVVVMFPVIALLAFTVLVLSLREDR